MTIELINKKLKWVDELELGSLRCKHAFGNSPREKEVIKLSLSTGYEWSKWGSHSGHIEDFQFHYNRIINMPDDRAVRIVICNYPFDMYPSIWVDNLHTYIKYVRKLGINDKLSNIPYYIVDIYNQKHIQILDSKGVFIDTPRNRLGVSDAAFKRLQRSSSRQLIEFNYTVSQFLEDNPEFLK